MGGSASGCVCGLQACVTEGTLVRYSASLALTVQRLRKVLQPQVMKHRCISSAVTSQAEDQVQGRRSLSLSLALSATQLARLQLTAPSHTSLLHLVYRDIS